MDSDIERALQHAIGQANSAFATGIPSADIVSLELPRKKGKKRAREADEGEPPKEKKRKKKKNSGASELDTVAASSYDGATHQDVTIKAKGQKHAKPQAHHGTTASAIDLPAVVGDPASSVSPAQTAALISSLASKSSDHLPVNQMTQDMYCPPAVPQFQGFTPGDPSLASFNTNDDILRAFQDLDLTRLAGVLRSLDLPFSPSTQVGDSLNGDMSASFLDQMLSNASDVDNISQPAAAGPSERRGASGPANTAKKRPSKVSKAVTLSNPNLATIGPSIASPDHTHLLATKWLSTSKLKALVETEGLVYKKGKFSAMEEQALRTAIENYRVSHGLSAGQLTELIFSKSKEDNTFWPEITSSVPARPITAVYHHVHRVYHPLKYQGKWIREEDEALLKAVADYGQAWQKVSERVGRMAQDCRDRWKNHLENSSKRQHGHWSKEEEEELTRIVKEIMAKQGTNSDNDIFWGVVSKRMGNKRSRQQCRIKWTDSLSKSVKNSGNTPRWSKQDSFILVHKVASLDVRDDSEIDWNILPDPDWNLWSAHSMQRRWRSLKMSIKGHETMPFQEIIEILQQKHTDLPSVEEVTLVRNKNCPRKEPKSSELIDDDDDDEELVGGEIEEIEEVEGCI